MSKARSTAPKLLIVIIGDVNDNESIPPTTTTTTKAPVLKQLAYFPLAANDTKEQT